MGKISAYKWYCTVLMVHTSGPRPFKSPSYLQFGPPNSVHCVNSPFLKNLLPRQIFIDGPLCGKPCAGPGHTDVLQPGLVSLKSLQSCQRGKSKEKCNRGAIYIQTLSCQVGKFNNGIPKLIVNNFPAPKALCPCWGWINDFTTKYWIRRNSFMVSMGSNKNVSAALTSWNSEKLLSLFLSVKKSGSWRYRWRGTGVYPCLFPSLSWPLSGCWATSPRNKEIQFVARGYLALE